MIIVLRLSVMMFVGFMPLSFWFVTLGTYLGTNTGQAGSRLFSPGFIGIAYSTAAVGAMFAPLVVGAVADRLVPAERLLVVLQLGSAGALVGLLHAQSQSSFYWFMIAYFQCYIPTTSLAAAVAFHHLPNSTRQFAVVRMAGTAAWVVGGSFVGIVCPWLFGGSIEATIWPMRLAILAHVLAACYNLTLPHSPPSCHSSRPSLGTLLGFDALYLLRQRPIIVLLSATTVMSVAVQFYLSYANLYLNNLGIERAAGKLAMGQVVEIFCILLLPALIARLGVKLTFIVGAVGWSIRYALFAWGNADERIWMLYVAILLHGAAFTFVYITTQIFINSAADSSVRAAAQGLFAMLSMGLGHFIGGHVAGAAQAAFLTPVGVDPAPYDWHKFWLVPFLLATVPVALVSLSFTDSGSTVEE